MSAIRITHAVPLSESILLAIIEHMTNRNRDVIILAVLCEDILQTGNIKSIEKKILWPNDIQPDQCSEMVVFEIDKRLFDKTERWCTEVGVSVEQLVLAFIRFCACKDNQAALKEWFNPNRIVAELISTYDELLRVNEELLEIKQRFGIDKQEEFLKEHENTVL